MIKYESNTQRERFIKQGGASLWWTYTLSSVLHSAGCVIKPEGNISSFVGFERIDLESLKVNFKNMFCQAPNNPQNCIHFHSLRAGGTRGKGDDCAAPEQHLAKLPGWDLSWLPLGDATLSKLLLALILAVSPGHLLRTCSSLSLCHCGTTTAAAPTASAQLHMGLVFAAEKKSMKIDFTHGNDGIMYLTCP